MEGVCSGGGLVDIAKQGQGGLSKLGGAASALGGGGAVSALGNVAGAVEGVAQLGGAISGLSAGVLAAIPIIGAIALGIAAVAAAFQQADKAAEELVKTNLEALNKRQELVGSGAGTSDIQQQIAALNQQRAAEAEKLSILTNAYDQSIGSAGALTPVLQALSGAEETQVEAVNNSKTAVAGFDAQIQTSRVR